MGTSWGEEQENRCGGVRTHELFLQCLDGARVLTANHEVRPNTRPGRHKKSPWELKRISFPGMAHHKNSVVEAVPVEYGFL